MAAQLRRREFLMGSLGLAGAALLAACGTSGSTPTTSTTGAAVDGSPVAKKLSGELRYLLRGGTPDEIKATQDQIDSTFVKQTGVKVSVEPTDASADEKLTAAMVGGNAQDVFDTWLDNVTPYADRNQVLDVEPFVKRDLKAEDISDFYAWQWKDFSLPSGLRFGLPKFVNVMFVYYNVDMFEQAGIKVPDASWNHDNYADAARKLTNANTTGIFFPASGTDRWWYKIAEWGGTVVDPADNTKATFNSDEALAALEWIRKGIWDDKFIAQRLNIVRAGQRAFTAVPAAFAAGKLAMVEDGLYPFAHASTIAKKFRWAYAPVPQGPKARKVLGTADGFAIWKGTKNPDAAWEFIKYQASKEYQLYLTKTTGYLPNRYSVIDDWKKICVEKYPELANANLDLAPQAMKDGYPGNKPLFKKDGDATQIITPALQKLFDTGNTPVSYMKEIAQQVTAKMRA